MNSGNTDANQDFRRKRVERIKKIIIVGRRVMLIVPWVVVVILAIWIGVLKNRNNMNTAAKSDSNALNTIDLDGNGDAMSVPLASLPEDYEPDSSYDDIEAYTPHVIEMSQADVENVKCSNEEIYEDCRKVYLTFDDGPSSNTAEILDILKKYNVHATFFVIYKEGEANEALYRRIVDEGHTLGMHSCTHKYGDLYQSEAAFIADTETLRNYLYLVTGFESKYYRFPGGSSNKVSNIDMKVFGKLLNDNGIQYYDWNVSSQDATNPLKTKQQIFANVTENLEYFNTAMVLMHDTASKVSTVEALPEIIEYIQAMDNTVILPISEQTNPIQHVSVE